MKTRADLASSEGWSRFTAGHLLTGHSHGQRNEGPIPLGADPILGHSALMTHQLPKARHPETVTLGSRSQGMRLGRTRHSVCSWGHSYSPGLGSPPTLTLRAARVVGGTPRRKRRIKEEQQTEAQRSPQQGL